MRLAQVVAPFTSRHHRASEPRRSRDDTRTGSAVFSVPQPWVVALAGVPWRLAGLPPYQVSSLPPGRSGGRRAAALHGLADAVQHEPRGLRCQVVLPLDLAGADPVLARAHLEHDEQPRADRDLRPVEDRARSTPRTACGSQRTSRRAARASCPCSSCGSNRSLASRSTACGRPRRNADRRARRPCAAAQAARTRPLRSGP